MRDRSDQPGDGLHVNPPFPNTRYAHARAAAMVAILLLGACSETDEPGPESAFSCAPNGFLSTRLYGALSVSLDWRDDQLTCEGMPRPAGEGARIRLAGPLRDDAGSNTVAFILGLPDLERGRTASELATNITFMEEGTGRFFGTADNSGCWTDIEYHDPDEGGAGSTYLIGGTVYCVSALAELNGGSSIRFTELTFAARLDWDQPE